jgi:protein O-mannosyl-transferase
MLLTLILSVWAYFPGLDGIFIFDDYHNIVSNDDLKIEQFAVEDLWQASLSNSSGPLKRPVAMLSFAINHVLTGMDPWWMKLTNLFIHLINGLLVFFLVRKLFNQSNDNNRGSRVLIPYFIAGFWLVHPINVTAVSYIVQRMASLSATFVLLAIICYLKLREGKQLDWKSYVLSLSVLFFWLLGLLTKETAILLSLYIFAIEWCVYRFKTNSKNESTLFRILWALLATPWICVLLYVVYDPSFILNGYESRNFTLIERLLTESRIVSEYIKLIIIPNINNMGLFHDDIVISTSIISPISTLLSIGLLVSLLILAIKVRKKYALFSLGMFWFLGGHILESTVYPLELMFLHRNYLPSIGILMMIAVVIDQLYEKHRKLFSIGAIIVLLGFSLSTRSLAYQWSGDLRILLMEVMNNPNSVRANFKAGQVFKYYAMVSSQGIQRDKYKSKAIEYFNNIQKNDPENITGALGILETHLKLKEVPPRILIEQLIQELSVAKIDRGVINLFMSFKVCFIETECTLKSEDFERLIDALLSHRYIGNDIKRLMLIIKAEYFFEYHANVDIAIPLLLEAIILDSNLEDFMLLTQYYEEGGYFEQMERTINYLEEHDKLGRYKKFIRQSRKTVNLSLELSD